MMGVQYYLIDEKRKVIFDLNKVCPYHEDESDIFNIEDLTKHLENDEGWQVEYLNGAINFMKDHNINSMKRISEFDIEWMDDYVDNPDDLSAPSVLPSWKYYSIVVNGDWRRIY